MACSNEHANSKISLPETHMLAGVLKQKTSNTLKTPRPQNLKTKITHISGGSEIVSSQSPMRLKVEHWQQEF